MSSSKGVGNSVHSSLASLKQHNPLASDNFYNQIFDSNVSSV